MKFVDETLQNLKLFKGCEYFWEQCEFIKYETAFFDFTFQPAFNQMCYWIVPTYPQCFRCVAPVNAFHGTAPLRSQYSKRIAIA